MDDSLDEIRRLRSGDPRVTSQMLDLAPWRPVSAQPPIRRDLSIAAAPNTTAEELGDLAREALGDHASALEEIANFTSSRRANYDARVRNSYIRRSFVSALVAALAIAASCSSKKSSSGPKTVDVHGTLVTANTDVAVPGIVVLCSGQTVTTAADGTFSFTKLKTPYRLTFIDSTNKTAVVWDGLTIAAPVIPWQQFVATGRQMTIDGNVTGLQGGLDDLTGTAPHGGAGGASVNFSSGAFTGGQLSWYGATTNSFTLWAVGRGAGTSITAAGSTTLPVSDGVNQTGIAVAMATVTPVPVDVNVTGVPATWSGVLFFEMSDANSPSAAQLGSTGVTSSGTISFLAPQIPGSTGLTILASLESPAGSGGPTQIDTVYGVPGASASLALNSPLLATLPVDSATGVGLGTPFSWGADSLPALYQVTFTPNVGGAPKFILNTTATSVTIPDLSVQGLALPSSAVYGWRVAAFGSYSSADAFVTDGGAIPASGTRFVDQTEQRSFTTQ